MMLRARQFGAERILQRFRNGHKNAGEGKDSVSVPTFMGASIISKAMPAASK